MNDNSNHLISQDNISQVRRNAEMEHRTESRRQNGAADREAEELRQQSRRIEDLVGKIGALPDPEAQLLVQECLQETLSFYGKGLERILRIASQAEEAGEQVSSRLIEDGFVSALLLIHGLHPQSLEERLQQALDKVRPYMDSHGGSVEIASVQEGVAKLRLSGSCDGCPSSAVTLELAIKQAVEESCPDLLGLEVDGVVAFPEPGQKPKQKTNGAVSGWTEIAGAALLPESTMKAAEVEGIPLAICRVKDYLFAYKDLCPACELPLTTGTLKEGLLSCRLGHRFELQQAGRCTDDPDMHLSPFPLLLENGVAKVAVF